MSDYNPRIYWTNRARKEGKKYVAYKNSKGAFQKQLDVFQMAMEGALPEKGRILDFGCGVGRFAPFISPRVESYEGVDLVEEALGYAPDLPNATFTHLPEDKLPFPDGHFDGIMAITVLQHIVSPQDFELWTSELSRVVKHYGYFFIIDTPAPKRKVKRGYHMMWRTAEEIADALGARVHFHRMLDAEFENSHYCFLARKRSGIWKDGP